MAVMEDVVVAEDEEAYVIVEPEHVQVLENGEVAVSLAWLAQWRELMAWVEALPERRD